MTFSQMRRYVNFNIPQWSDAQYITLLNRVVPELRNLARPSCAKSLGLQEESAVNLERHTIEQHILLGYDFDAVDIGRIVGEFARSTARQKQTGSS
jgi:hypothetical protein